MTHFFRTLFVTTALLLAAAPASAQTRVVVMGPPGARDALAAALRVELAGHRTEVLVADPPLGTTRVARAASAQASARTGGADASVYVDVVDSGGGAVAVLRVVPAADAEVREAPLAETADARATAVVAASLLAELLGPPEPPPAPPVTVDVHTTVDVRVGTGAVPAPVAPPAMARSAGAEVAPPSSADRRDLTVDGGIGLGGTAFINDASVEGAGFLRGSVGLVLGEFLRLGLDADLIGVWEHEAIAGFRWTGRLGPSLELVLSDVAFVPGTAYRRGSGVSLRFGVHARGVVSSTWQYLSSVTGPSATESTTAGGVSVGGSIALAIPLSRGLALDLVLELDGMARDLSGRSPWVVPALVAGLTWS